MKRSQINAVILKGKKLLDKYQWSLPEWAEWSVEKYKSNPELANSLRKHQMGWDVTDFSYGDFEHRGLGLFCLRNGVQSKTNSKPYAEKLLFIEEGQETPFHYHKFKLEDIINRGGGELIIEFRHQDNSDKPMKLYRDGFCVVVSPNEPLSIFPGQSVTVPKEVYHRFYSKPGTGMVLGGEVSQVNDDSSDNYFLEPLGRFSSIEEDEPSIYPLWNEVGFAS